MKINWLVSIVGKHYYEKTMKQKMLKSFKEKQISLKERNIQKIFGWRKSSCYAEIKKVILLIARITNFFFWTFRRWEVLSFFKSENWWKGNACFKVKRSYFDVFGKVFYSKLFGDGKQCLFKYRMLIEELCLLDTNLNTKVNIGKTDLFNSERWWKDDACLIFFRFLWNSRTWEI